MSSHWTRTGWISFLVVAWTQMNGLRGQVVWTQSDQNPVLEVGNPGEWDSAEMLGGWLIKVGDDYKLWYIGTDSTDLQGFFSDAALGCATSKDLIHWTKCGGEGSFCDQNPVLLKTPSVALLLRDDDPQDPKPYKAWHKIGDSAGSGSIYFATSPDGCHWTPYPDPVLTPDPGTWEMGSVAAHSVLFDKRKGTKGTYRMWYTAQGSDCSTAKIGYAESEDGIHWTKSPANPVLGPDETQTHEVFMPRVLFDKDSGIFEMLYVFRCSSADNYATSLDGVTWCKYAGNPFPLLGQVLDAGLGAVLYDGGLYHMIYNRFDSTTLGYATSPWSLPRASFTITPENGTGPRPLKVTVDASRSTTPTGSIALYAWDFGDGETTEGGDAQAEHTYAAAGQYLLKLTVTDSAGAVGQVARKVEASFAGPNFRRGDANADGNVDISDAVGILGFLFLGDAPLGCLDAADVNDDAKNDISDPVSLLGYLFVGQKAPPEPFAACGTDPSAESLGCRSFPACP